MKLNYEQKMIIHALNPNRVGLIKSRLKLKGIVWNRKFTWISD
jgi:hypothetical protein